MFDMLSVTAVQDPYGSRHSEGQTRNCDGDGLVPRSCDTVSNLASDVWTFIGCPSPCLHTGEPALRLALHTQA